MATDVVVVRLNGGPAAGAVVELPANQVDRLDIRRLTITPTGKLYCRTTQRYVSGAVVVERPGPAKPKRERRPRPSSNLELRENELPQHKPSKARPPRATAPRTG